MKEEINHIFFDLDHTLWDYDRNAYETLAEIHDQLSLHSHTELQKFVDTFYKVNEKLWHKYNLGQIDRQHIKEQRFAEVFETIGVNGGSANEASDYFVATCSSKPHLMPDTVVVLDYLKTNYKLHIITNGFEDTQPKKLSSAGIQEYFEVVVTSESSQARKPSPEIFEFALDEVDALREESVMIGDNPRTDINGAREFGMRTILYDPSGRKRSMADVSIQSLMELVKIF